MGRKGNWFSLVKKAFSPESKKKKGQKSNKSKAKWSGKEKSAVPESPSETVTVSHPVPPPEQVKLTGVEDDQTKHAYSVAVATAVAAEAAVAAAQAAAEVLRLTAVTRFTGKSKEEVAAIKIQTAFRGYLARRAFQTLRGLARLKSLVQGLAVKHQTINALRFMQTIARVQSQIQSRRIRMSEENQALQRQLLQKRAKELVNLQIGEEWDDSLQSKERIEASLLSKYEAAIRRERALAYSFSHQKTCKKSTRSATLMFMDSNNPHWGWSWLERFIGARQLETGGMTEKEINNDHSSVKRAILSTVNGGGKITKAYFGHQLNSDKPSPASTRKPVLRPSTQRSPSTPPSKAASSTVARKLKAASLRGGAVSFNPDDDTRSMFSVQSGMNRRHSIAGSSVKDDESLASYPAVPSYMATTQSAKAKSRMQNLSLSSENGTPLEEPPAVSVKKRLSYPPSPARPRRHSGPPKVDLSSAAEQRHGVAS